ncbi:MAG: 50S ribosomal protein L29 [Candidatus Woesearchaeota archaeon]
MKFKDLKDLQLEELEKKQKDLRLELIKLRAQVATGSAPKNSAQIRNVRKSIAKILTELKIREVRRNG